VTLDEAQDLIGRRVQGQRPTVAHERARFGDESPTRASSSTCSTWAVCRASSSTIPGRTQSLTTRNWPCWAS